MSNSRDYIKNNVSRETFEKLELFVALLTKWNKSINLISPKSLGEVWDRHILDSYQLLPFIVKDEPLLDIGSGGGFPGMILAICGASKTHLVDSDQRKCSFLRNVSRETMTPTTVHNQRVESLENQNYKTITSRACAPLTELFGYTHQLTTKATTCLFLKGENYLNEIHDAQKEWTFSFECINSSTSHLSKIIKIDGAVMDITNAERHSK